MDVNGVGNEFGLDPEADTMGSTDPSGQRGESGGVVGEPAELALDVGSPLIQVTSEVGLQQGDRSQSGFGTFAFRYQLVAASQGHVMQRVAVKGFVAEEVAAALFQERDETEPDLGLADVQRRHIPLHGIGPRP